ncbi:MAG: SIMPL domain-containing protein [Pirellulaceae bacterium]
MHSHNYCVALASWSLLAVLPSFVMAQFGDIASPTTGGGIVGTGTVTVKEQPTLVRMSIQLQEKAETVEAALARLKDRREAALQQLESFGADKESLVVEPPTLAAGKTSQQRQMEQVLRMRQMQGRRIPKGMEKPHVVTVTSNLTAQWPLDMKSSDEMLAFVNELQNKVTAADLAGVKEAKEISPEEEELNEEMQQMMGSMSYGEEEVNPGEPQFLYVAKLKDEARDTAMTEAFTRAKAHAEQLAKAAGIELGPLTSLRGSTGRSDEESAMMQYYGGGSYAARMMIQQASGAGGGDAEMEAFVSSPTAATFHIVVAASFAPQ